MQHRTPGASRLCLLLAGLALGFAASSVLAGETTNRIGITMVDIPAGSFVMGACPQDQKSAFLGESSCANPDPEATTAEAPQHRAFSDGQNRGHARAVQAFYQGSGT